MDSAWSLLGVFFVIAALAGLLWMVRRKGWLAARTQAQPLLLESWGKLSLTPRHSIHLVRIGERVVAVVLHPEGAVFLGDLTPSEVTHRETGASR